MVCTRGMGSMSFCLFVLCVSTLWCVYVVRVYWLLHVIKCASCVCMCVVCVGGWVGLCGNVCVCMHAQRFTDHWM